MPTNTSLTSLRTEQLGLTCAQLPASFFAYRKQQHRWTCGPVQLWRKAAADIWASGLPTMRKLDLILLYFGVRKFSTHWVSLGFFCTLVPLSIFTPEVGPQLLPQLPCPEAWPIRQLSRAPACFTKHSTAVG